MCVLKSRDGNISVLDHIPNIRHRLILHSVLAITEQNDVLVFVVSSLLPML